MNISLQSVARGLGLAGAVSAILFGLHVRSATAHCQVPCGIYDDPARISRMKEDTETITKAMRKIRELSSKHDPEAFNQATRWTATKEAHADNIISIVSAYFLTQKVKPIAAGTEGHDDYLRALADHHRVMVAAMKAKQHVSAATATALQEAIAQLATHYQGD